MTSGEIETLIRQGLPEAEVHVLDETGGGDHFNAVVVTEKFQGKSLVERHQMIYETLGGAMAGRIHALRLKTYTPAEVG
jgi:stress-induced morphogen